MVRQRVEAWRRRGLRQGLAPEAHDLSYSENASVQMMVGYFRYERPRSDCSAIASPPILRVLAVQIRLLGRQWSHLSYLQPLPIQADMPRTAILGTTEMEPPCEMGEVQESLPATETDGGCQSMGTPNSSPEDVVESWQEELPSMEVEPAVLEEHYTTGHHQTASSGLGVFASD